MSFWQNPSIATFPVISSWDTWAIIFERSRFHSNDRGYGMNYLMPRHKTWVLSRLAVEMIEMPNHTISSSWKHG